MKITESTLRRIIREEMAALAEGRHDRGTGTMWDPDADPHGRGEGDYPEGGSDEYETYERDPGHSSAKVNSLVRIFKQEHRHWADDFKTEADFEFAMNRVNRVNELGATPAEIKAAAIHINGLAQNERLPSWSDTRRRRSRY